MGYLEESFGQLARKYGQKVRRTVSGLTGGVLDREERTIIKNRFKGIGPLGLPRALYDTWKDVRRCKYIHYFLQNWARQRYRKAFKKGSHRGLKLLAFGMIIYMLFFTGQTTSLGICFFSLIFLLWFPWNFFMMVYAWISARRAYRKGLDPPERAGAGFKARFNFTYIIGTVLFLFGLLSILFLIPPLSTPWEVRETQGRYIWPLVYILLIILWLLATRAVVASFWYSHSLGLRLALLNHDRGVLGRARRKEQLNKYGKALTRYIYIPVILSAGFIALSLMFKYLYAIIIDHLRTEEFSTMDSLGTTLLNLLGGESSMELPEWLPRIGGIWLILLQFTCIMMFGIGTYLRNRKINSVLWPNTPQSPAGKKVTMLIEDLGFLKSDGDTGEGTDVDGKDVAAIPGSTEVKMNHP